MDEIVLFLSNPVVGVVGYAGSLIAAIIAISQFLGKSKAQKKIRELKIEITNIQAGVYSNNKVSQGSKSQYFQDNSGPVNIDNRD